MKQALKKAALVTACAAGMAATMQVEAANWLMLQGTEPDSAAGRAKVWGFLQPTYLKTSGNDLPAGGPFAGQLPQFEGHQPDLSSPETFQIMRARLGVRGTGMPIDPKVNYFFMAEFGNNGISQPGGGAGAAKLTDASVTFNHIKGMRVRVGQMKTPMSEELYQGIPTFNYINMTNLANQQMIERPFWTDGRTACNTSSSDANYLKFCNGDAQTQFRSNSVPVRDIGIQLFDTFNTGGWESSYSLLWGMGGTNKDNRNDKYDTTLYLSTEKVFSGKGPRRDHMKFFAWSKKGKRTIYDSAMLNSGSTYTAAEKEFDRNLQGLGMTYQRGKYRFWAEYTKVAGMIFNGSTGGAVPGAVNSNDAGPNLAGDMVSQFLLAPEAEGDGGYVDFGYKVLPNLELMVRYDWYNRVTNDGDDNGFGGTIVENDERKYVTTTYGMQYFFNKKTKLLVNYEARSLEAPHQPDASYGNMVGDEMSNRLSAQVTHIF